MSLTLQEKRVPPHVAQSCWAVRTLALVLSFLSLSAPLQAETPATEGLPLTANEFDALTLGKTWDTYNPSGLYGVEHFLPGRRSVWQDAGGCVSGRWEADGAQICFHYEDQPKRPVCWIYKLWGAEIHGWYQGNFAEPQVRLIEGAGSMECDVPSV